MKKRKWKKKATTILAGLLVGAMVLPMLPDGNVSAEAWVATPYTKEDGTVVEGLETAVSGKRHWLETTEALPVAVTEDNGVVKISNGVITREFKIPQIGGTEFYTQSYRNEYIGKELLENEAKPDVYLGLYDEPYEEVYDDTKVRQIEDTGTSAFYTLDIQEGAIKIDPDYYFIGGTSVENTFVFDGYTVQNECEKPFEWSPNAIYGDPAAEDWPPKGKHIEFNFSAPDTFPEVYRGIKVKVIYEMYDNLAAMKKRVEITNTGKNQIMIGRLANEVLNGNADMDELLLMETSYTCGEKALPVNTELPCSCDEEKSTSPFAELVNMNHSCYDVGPAYELVKDQTFVAYDTYELIYSTYWFELRMRERLGMYRKLFPWITDNPLTFHSTTALNKSVIDHAAESGFEMVIQSYGVSDPSNGMLNTKQETLDYYKELIDYAHSKNIAIGFYQAQYVQDVGDASYGANGIGKWGTWCLATAAFDDYWDDFKYFVKYTGVDCVEIDGPYPGCYCNNGAQHSNCDKRVDPDPEGTDKTVGDASKYAVHKGYFDSYVKQWENSVRLLCKEFRNMGVYIKVPSWYYLNGANKHDIGAEEIAWSQPREEQLIYSRQIIYNSSYIKSPSMSWSHTPFVQYHGGGSDAAYYPFKDHIEDYNWVMAQNLGNGIVSDFRGDVISDEATVRICNKWVKFYQRYRGIVNSDMIHISQATYDSAGVDKSRTIKMDTLYHVNANNEGEKGLLWVYNQTDEERTEVITVPMYYTGLTNLSYPPASMKDSLGKDVYAYGEWPPNYDWLPDEESNYVMPDVTGEITGTAAFVREGVQVENITIDSNGNAQITVTLKPMSFTYFAIYDSDEVPVTELEIGKVTNVSAGNVIENSVKLVWDKDVDVKLTENGVVSDNSAVTMDYYNIYRNGKFIVKSLTNTYTDSGLDENTSYKYTVEAVACEIPGTKSDELSVTTKVDEVKPIVENVNAEKKNEILIRFSERIDKTTAEDVSNYKLSDGKNVISATVEDGTNVRLKVDDLKSLVTYELEINGVKDISKAGNKVESTRKDVVYGYIARYDFESTENGIILDATGDHDGKLYNAAQGSLYNDGAVVFEAAKKSYADIGSGLLNGLKQYSISMWIQPEAAGEQVLLSQGQEKFENNDFTLYLKDGVVKFRISDADGHKLELSANDAVKPEKWTLVTLIRDNDSFTLGINGVTVDTEASAGMGASATTNALYIGAIKNHAGGDRTAFYTGLMDEVTLYNVVLSAEQLAELARPYEESHLSCNVSAYRSGDTYTYPVKEGYVFAGWYTDSAYTTSLGADVKTGKAYPKFVPEEVLSVKCQISSNTTIRSERTNLRLITSVDSVQYTAVGFQIEVDGKKSICSTKEAYRTLYGYADNSQNAYEPNIFSADSKYFMAYEIKDVPSGSFLKTITVTPLWETLDGTIVMGTAKVFKISSLL